MYNSNTQEEEIQWNLKMLARDGVRKKTNTWLTVSNLDTQKGIFHSLWVGLREQLCLVHIGITTFMICAAQ